MGLRGGRWVFQNPANGAVTSIYVEDVTPSKVAAAETSAAAALSIAVSAMRLQNHGRGGDPRRGNSNNNS